jgi:alpha-1,2-mannosyltransferase
MGDIQEGQTNLVMLCPLTVGLWLAQAGRPRGGDGGKEWVAGILIALAAAIKVTPIVFLAYFLLTRRWRVVGGIVLGLGLWLVLVPGLLFGFGQNLHWLESWARVMIFPYVAQGHVEYFSGQSVASFVSRLLRHVPAFENHAGAAVFVNVVDWSAGVVKWIIRGLLLGAGLAGAGWILARRRRREHGRAGGDAGTLAARAYLVEIGAVAAFMLWASERTWVPHYVSLVLTLAAVACVAAGGSTNTRQRLAWVALSVAAVALMLTSDLNKAFGPDAFDYFKTFGICLGPSVLLVGVLLEPRVSAGDPIEGVGAHAGRGS